MAGNYKPSFAQKVRGNTAVNLKRPTCLNFKTKTNLRRVEILQMLSEISFKTENLIGVAEMKNRSIDITCKTRENVLELYAKLKDIEFIYNLLLYEPVNINILFGWVPIPMPNETIKQELEANFGAVLKITDKKHSDGLRSGMRIVTMKKSDLQNNPIPSYIRVSGCEIYVTYQGQVITCKYCGEAGHVQSECQERAMDFPALTRNKPGESNTVLPETKVHSEPVNLSKKRKISQSELNETDSVATTSSIKIRKQLNSTSNHLETDQVENQSKAVGNIEFANDQHLPTEIQPTTDKPKKNNQNDSQIQQSTLSQDWWRATCQIACIWCNAQVLTEETSTETTCDECGEEKYVVSPCCDKQDSNQRFSVKMNERYTECCVCKSDMMRLSCCNLFQPIQQLDNNLFECLKCAKYSIVCVCQNVNKLPPKTMNFKCTNSNCSHFTVHCNCGRITYQELKSPYQCPCGYEFEHDINLGVKTN